MKYLRNRLTIPVKGYNRSMIYDLGCNDYFFIPNELFEIIKSDSSFKIDDEDYRAFLLSNEIIFEIEEEEIELFPSLNLEFKSPYDFTNIIIESDVNISCHKLFKNALIHNITIIVRSDYGIEFSVHLLDFIETIQPESIDIHFVSDELKFDLSELNFIFKRNEIFNIYVYNGNSIDEKSRNYLKKYYIQLIEVPESFHEFSKNVYPSKFSVNNESFFEAVNHNTYLNRKAYINSDGFIRNSLYTEYGVNISTIDSFRELLNIPQLREYWDITKNKIHICKDCEFRYMCVDPRSIYNKKDNWYHQLECNYNPYISKWKWEENYKKLEEISVSIDINGEIYIDEKQVSKVNKSIWSDQ